MNNINFKKKVYSEVIITRLFAGIATVITLFILFGIIGYILYKGLPRITSYNVCYTKLLRFTLIKRLFYARLRLFKLNLLNFATFYVFHFAWQATFA